MVQILVCPGDSTAFILPFRAIPHPIWVRRKFSFSFDPENFFRRYGKPRNLQRAPASAMLASSAPRGGIRKATRVTSAANSAWPRVRVLANTIFE
jgi:hypothetical protein